MDTELIEELLRRRGKDQAARLAGDHDAWEAADAENLPWLKRVIATTGWPGISQVGPDGAEAAWLLVQHADADPAFQRHCLGLLTAAAERGDASLSNVAYLTDRVLLAEGKPQEYGTQAWGTPAGWVPRNLRDPAGADERRAQMELGPLTGYLARMLENYGPPRPSTMPCQGCGASLEFWAPADNEARSITLTCDECGAAQTLRFARADPAGRSKVSRSGAC